MNRRIKQRFLMMGGILSVLGLALTAIRGAGIGYVVILGVGIVLLIVGVFMKSTPSPSPA